MYSLFLRNIEGFLSLVEPNSYTVKCFKPIALLGNLEEFKRQKLANTILYQNAKILINEVFKLKSTKKYHRIGVLLRELEDKGIIFDNAPVKIQIDTHTLQEQVSLLWQCMFFNYVLV